MSIALKLLHCDCSCWSRFTVWVTEMVSSNCERFLRLLDRVGQRWSSARLRGSGCRRFRCFLSGRFLFIDGPHGRPGSATIGGPVNAEIRSEIDYVGITRVLKDRIRDETRRHTAHRRLPTLAVVVTDKEEAATSRSVDGRSIHAIWCFPVCENRICKATTEDTIRRRERLATIIRNHHAVVIGGDVNHLRPRRMNRDRVDLELSRGGHHPGIRVAAFVRQPEAFRRSGEDHARNCRVLKDGARAT